MTSLSEELDAFAEVEDEPAPADRVREPDEPKPRRARKPRSRHVRAHETGVPIPGEEQATVNLRHWTALGKTDPAHTKPFTRAGGFKGTAIKPIWTEKRMTEHFGPAGLGWGMNQPIFQLVPIEGNGELLVYCTVELWYREEPSNPAKLGAVFGVGGDKVISRGRDGLRTSDEAFKAAYTDALGNAMKHLGVAADVHIGLFDDSKYVREMTEAFAQPTITGNEQQQQPGAAERLLTPSRPSPAHIELLLREAAGKTQLPKDKAMTWFKNLDPEDQEILIAEKARRDTARQHRSSRQ